MELFSIRIQRTFQLVSTHINNKRSNIHTFFITNLSFNTISLIYLSDKERQLQIIATSLAHL